MEKLNAIDLRIVEHLDTQKLPESVQQMISLASTPEEQDIILMTTLPDEFGHQILIKEAASQGIPSRTAERWNESWQQQGIVYRIRHDRYKKSA